MDAAIKYLVVNEGGPLMALVDLQGNFNQSSEMSAAKATLGANYHLEMNHLACFAPGMFALGAHKWQGLLSRKKRARSVLYLSLSLANPSPSLIPPLFTYS